MTDPQTTSPDQVTLGELTLQPPRAVGVVTTEQAGTTVKVDEKAALIWARLMAEGTAKGTPRSALDTIIASIAAANDCIVVTDNEKDFADVEIVNPLR